jgi:hypothetical protein
MLSPASEQTVTIDYSTNDSTAVEGEDYVSVSGQLVFSPGDTSNILSVEVLGDTVVENTETFQVILNNVTNAIIEDNQGSGTITNDDGLPSTITVSFQDGLNDYSGTRDAKIQSDTPIINYGSSSKVGADGSPDESALLYWDISSITAGSSILSVEMTFNVISKSGLDNYEIYRINRAWIENEVTWNVYASGQNWEIEGANGMGDRDSTVLGNIGAPLAGELTISLNSTGIEVVQSWVNDPGSNNGLIFLDYINASDGLDLSSRETSIVSERPKLTITYSNTAPIASENPDSFDPESTVLPKTIALHSNYPNPFNLVTTIDYSLHIDIPVQITIYNIMGQKIRTLIDAVQLAGYNTITWNGKDDNGTVVSSGIYFIQLLAGGNRFVHKIILQK